MTQNGISHTARRLFAAVALTIPLLVVLISWWMLLPDLPAELASHWSDAGPADDAMSTGAILAMCLVMTALGAVVGWAVVIRPTLALATQPWLLFFAGVPAGLGVTIWLTASLLTIQAGDPYKAVLGGWLLATLLSTAYGAIPMALVWGMRHRIRDTDAAARSLAASNASSGDVHERDPDASWSLDITSRLFAWLAAGLGIGSALLYGLPTVLADPGQRAESVTAGLIGGTIVLLGMGVMFALVRTRAIIDARGLRLESLWFGVAFKQIPLDEIVSADVTFIRPGEWGGWGYRVMPGRSAFITETGPGFVVETAEGKLFALTVPEPEDAVAALCALKGWPVPAAS